MKNKGVEKSFKHVVIVARFPNEQSWALWEGVQEFAGSQHDWIVSVSFGRNYTVPKHSSASAVIAITGSDRETDLAKLRQLKLPVISVTNDLAADSFPSVVVDNAAIGKTAAEHFLLSRHLALACVGDRKLPEQRVRLESFVDTAERHDRKSEQLLIPSNQIGHSIPGDEISTWLCELRKPAGIFCADDLTALTILNAARVCSLAVPEEVQILGTSTNDSFCESNNPSISAIQLPVRQIGYLAAEALSEVFQGKRIVPSQLVSPQEIHLRKSTDPLAVASKDNELRNAIAYIKGNATKPINVSDVVRAVAISRSKLERMFRIEFDSTIREVMLQHRIRIAKELLMESDKTIAHVAEMCGFQNYATFSGVFRQSTGFTPSAFRKSAGAIWPTLTQQ